MPTQADFLNNPWDFLKHHIVLMGMEGYGDAGVKWFKLTPRPRNKAYAVSTIFNIKSDVFVLEGLLGGSTAGYFQAYWCPYEREETKFAVIGTAANFCFTAQISGCSIGLGHETGAGDKLIIHSNHGSTPAQGLTVAQTQEQDIRALGGQTIHKVFGPSNYRLDSRGRGRYQGTVVGWRGPNGAGPWEFRTQTYEQLPQLSPEKYALHKLVKM
jgi:hypothetical protein